MATLMEKYAKRLNVCESIYREKHDGEAMPHYKKVMIARVVENTRSSSLKVLQLLLLLRVVPLVSTWAIGSVSALTLLLLHFLT